MFAQMSIPESTIWYRRSTLQTSTYVFEYTTLVRASCLCPMNDLHRSYLLQHTRYQVYEARGFRFLLYTHDRCNSSGTAVRSKPMCVHRLHRLTPHHADQSPIYFMIFHENLEAHASLIWDWSYSTTNITWHSRKSCLPGATREGKKLALAHMLAVRLGAV